ncbi:MAG: CRTAC1 family protein [Verrucomicrobia bacterium]|nr:CRTAC1 family protein [Verrucomicrobiota bacterium]
MKRHAAKSGLPAGGRDIEPKAEANGRGPALPPRTPRDARFLALLAAAWVGVGAMLSVDALWLPVAVGFAVAGALWVGRRQPIFLRVLVLLALVYPAWRIVQPGPSRPRAASGEGAAQPAPASQAQSDDALIGALVTAEETHLALSPKLNALAEGLLDLRLPGPATAARQAFAPAVTVVDLAPAAAPTGAGAAVVESHAWPLATPAQRGVELDLWRPLLDGVAYFEHARFFMLEGEHPGGDMLRYESASGFEGLAWMKSGEWRSLHARMGIAWEREQAADGQVGAWQIAAWRTEEMYWHASPKRFFVEALDRALRAPAHPAALRRSQHYEATLAYYREGMQKLPHPYFAPISVNQKEGLAVADINGDGFDDIYITVRLGKNLLLINQGDGTFSEEAAAYRLDLPGHTTCAIFADFDNDGDLDAMLGRSLLRSSYLENRAGLFYQHPIPKYMPMAVISMAAADYNGDGLLDIYLCTYRPAAPAGAGTSGGYAQAAKQADFDWPDEFFSPELAREFRRRVQEHEQQHGVTVLDQLGPPNVLLVNRGGGQFEPAPENDTVGLWRNSLQATWCDYNGDGRPDLYVPNDWGLNVLFRNDGPAGFTDVTAEAGLTWYGFSMGASFGDYDNDGRDDLYISNMYSEAGRRLTARIPGLNKLFAESAMGNWLYRQGPDGTFKQVAGWEPPALTVMKVGWSWGGCFTDYDNDGFLDLYVLSGYYTAPRELASGLDLESNLWRTMVRADENLARSTFRFSPEWKRTPAPDRLGPQIDARLAGVERQGERIRVHSLHGHERNRYFANRAGRSFVEISALTGLDHPADSRGFAVLDYDRDGWQDLAMVNANQPLFNLYHNQMPAAGLAGGMIALRFVGGNRAPAPSSQYACRDGYGARVVVELGENKLVREHRCGEGWSTQHSSTMIVGVGAHATVASVSVRWPSGLTASTSAVPEGTLLTAYENPADSPSGQAFTRESYRRPPPLPPPRTHASSVFAVRMLDPAAKPARLRAYTTFASSAPAWTTDLIVVQRLKEALGSEGVDIVAVPVDAADDTARLAAYAQQWKPTARLAQIAPAQRAEAAAAYARLLGPDPPLPSTVVTDDSGHILTAHVGVPNLSTLRKLLLSDFRDATP